MTEALDSNTYGSLLHEVQGLLEPDMLLRGEGERERVPRYWEVGRRIEAVVAPNGRRAVYGQQVLERLAADIDMRLRLLYEMVSLFRLFPALPTSTQLGWCHYRVLLRVGSKRGRTFYVKQIKAHSWSVRQLEMHVQEGLFERVTGAETELPPLPRGRLYTYPVVGDESGGVRLDLGFGIRCGPAVVALDAVASGDMAESRGTKPPATVPFAAHKVELVDEEADTYLARVQRVVDGDTLAVTVDLGFGVEVDESLRLRGIDAPELSRQAGVRAREFVCEALEASERVVIATRHRDKYGRWLADLYYHPNWRDGKRILKRGRLLNGEMVEGGLAARYGG